MLGGPSSSHKQLLSLQGGVGTPQPVSTETADFGDAAFVTLWLLVSTEAFHMYLQPRHSPIYRQKTHSTKGVRCLKVHTHTGNQEQNELGTQTS